MCWQESYQGNGQRYLTILVFVLALAAIGALVVFSAFAADNDPPCMTKAQARAKWPREILYWHTANHCWDNVPIKRHRYAPPLKHFADNSHKGDSIHVKTVRPDEYNEIDAQADRDVFFRSTAMPLWPPLMPTPSTILLDQRFTPWEERIR